MPVGRAMPARGVAARRRQGAERVLRPARDRMVPDRAAAEGRAGGARQGRGRRAAGRASRTCSSATSREDIRQRAGGQPEGARARTGELNERMHDRRRPISVRSRARVATGDIRVDRPDADAVAGLSDHRAAAGARAMRAVPHGGGVALRRARAGLVLEQLQPAASTPARISTRRSTGSPARTCRTTRSTRSTLRNSSRRPA